MFAEFTCYMVRHPDFGDNTPKGAELILLDRRFCRWAETRSRSFADAKTEGRALVVELK